MEHCAPWTQDIYWKRIRCSEDVKDTFWTSYGRSIYALFPEGELFYNNPASV